MMTPERWQKVRDVLEQALELAPEKRARFLDAACLTDHSLRSEVESLLPSDEQAHSSFVAQPKPRSALTKATKLGEYEIVSLLGTGGMGEVYRARDSRLGRDVAIKVLPAHFSSDTERLRRFDQEARAAAALNHPNILAVHQLGTYEGSPYLVSELLEGETLREQLKRGALTQRKAVEYGEQIARGLAAAHEKGIVHRDLKPENLFVTKDGRVKILDFGLAKLVQPESDATETVATLNHETQAGMVLGTVGYMSPEQVRGQNVDNRADIFAFGAILYEMLTGRRAFQKETSADTMSAILQEDPQRISQISPSVPTGLQRVVQRCLEKNPEQRFQSASDLAFALEALTDALSPSATAERRETTFSPEKSRSTGKISIVIAGVVLALLAGVYWWARPSPPPRVVSYSALTHDGVAKYGPLLTDGSRIYFVEQRDGARVLAEVSTAGGDTALAHTPFFGDLFDISRDHSSLLITSASWDDIGDGGPLWILPVPAGAPRRVGDLTARVAAWSPDSRSIAYGQGNNVFVSEEGGGHSRRLASLSGIVTGITWSPDGNSLRLIVDDRVHGELLNWPQFGEFSVTHPNAPSSALRDGVSCGTYSHTKDPR